MLEQVEGFAAAADDDRLALVNIAERRESDGPIGGTVVSEDAIL